MNGSIACSRSLRLAVLPAAVATALMLCNSANAFQIRTGNPDLELRWDNTVRYNLGFRAEDCDKNICGNGAGAGDVVAHQSDRKFSKSGDIVTNRLDLLSEFDFIYKRDTGFRVSAAGWYDAAYSNRVKGDPALNAAGSVAQGAGSVGGQYSDYTKRWNIGPSGEFLDAFLFTKFDLGSASVNVKLGQHNLYWGESLFSFVGSVAYNQGPVDIRKATVNPGTEAKELFRPLNQLSFNARVLPRLSLSGQYLFDWKPSTLPDGGTYFGAADGVSLGGGTVFGAPVSLTKAKRKRGDWGLAARWQPEWLDGGTAGFYYREYTNKFPQLVMTSVAVLPGSVIAPAGFGLDYTSAKREKLYGASLSTQIAGISWGAEMTYRPDAVLMAVPFGTFVSPGTNPRDWVPTGNVWTGLVNAMAYIGKTPLFDSGSLMAELTYSHLRKVTANAGNFFGENYSCADSANPTYNACPTRNAFGTSILFEPKWFQVWSGVDVTMPLFYSIGLRGNSPVLFGDNKGQGSWSVGVAAEVRNKYNFAIKYNGFNSRHRNDYLGAASSNNSSLGKYWDRDWISITFKTAF